MNLNSTQYLFAKIKTKFSIEKKVIDDDRRCELGHPVYAYSFPCDLTLQKKKIIKEE